MFTKKSYYNRFFSRFRQGIAEIIALFDKKEKFLCHQKWVAKLIKDGKMENTMKCAEALGRKCGASYTNVWKAIKEML